MVAPVVISMTESKALSGILSAGFGQSARHLAEIAVRPNVLEVKPLTCIRHCERALRCWTPRRAGPRTSNGRFALRLLAAALAPKLSPDISRKSRTKIPGISFSGPDRSI